MLLRPLRVATLLGLVATLVSACSSAASDASAADDAEGAESALGAGPTCQFASEGQDVKLACPAGQVITGVKFASYGNWQGGCARLERGSCHAFATEREVESRCLDRASCVVPATSRAFYDPCPGTHKRLKVAVTCGAPTLRPFYRHQPFLGNPVTTIPDYALKSDFPYHRRNAPQEVPFADSGTVVRLLGGVGQQGSENFGADLVTRNADGTLQFHPERLAQRLAPYLDAGYRGRDMTLVLDNTPWALTKVPVYDSYGNEGIPGLAPDGSYDPSEWGWFIEQLALALKATFGEEEANFLRFRMGTEYRFSGTQDQFFTHYDYATAAVRSVLPGAHVSGPNAAGVSLAGLDHAKISAYALAEHTLDEPNRQSHVTDTRFDFFAASRYVHMGADLDRSAQGLVSAYQELGRRYPALAHVPLEVHEWAPQPWVSDGYWPTAEPGPWGTAQLLQVLVRYQAVAGAQVYHWGTVDLYRDETNALRSLWAGNAFMYTVLDAMVGGESWTAQAASYPSASGVRFLGIGSKLANRSIFFFAAADELERSDFTETATFTFPARFVGGRQKLSYVRLDRTSSPHQAVRDDLARGGKLLDTAEAPFLSRPLRLGSIREMQTDTSGERTIVGPNRAKYEQMYVDALTKKPLGTDGTLTFQGDQAVLTVNARVPSVTAIVFEP